VTQGRIARILTSVGFAAAQLALIAVIAVAGTRWFPVLGVLVPFLCLCALTVAWNRRPYDRARLGFLLVHLSPALIVLGLLGPRWVAWPAILCLALGLPWMFWLKPLLKAKKPGPRPPAWERFTLQGTRILFLGAGALLVAPFLKRTAPPLWVPASWLLLAVALHLHHVKAWKGRRAQLAGLAAWGLCLAAYLRLR
jgi:hypothetical protein